MWSLIVGNITVSKWSLHCNVNIEVGERLNNLFNKGCDFIKLIIYQVHKINNILLNKECLKLTFIPHIILIDIVTMNLSSLTEFNSFQIHLEEFLIALNNEAT